MADLTFFSSGSKDLITGTGFQLKFNIFVIEMRNLFYIVLLLSFAFKVNAQPNIIKKRKIREVEPARFGVGFGVTRSVLYLSRNIKEQNDANGFTGIITYHSRKNWRFTAEVTRFNTLNIEPTWLNIQAYTYELNAQLCAKFASSRTLFYPLFGLSYNTFRAYFTGVNDFMNLKAFYPVQSQVNTNWLGANVGAGMEHSFKGFSIFATYRMRVGKMERKNQFNIMDVCYGAGLRYDIKLPKSVNIFKGTRGRYNLD